MLSTASGKSIVTAALLYDLQDGRSGVAILSHREGSK